MTNDTPAIGNREPRRFLGQWTCASPASADASTVAQIIGFCLEKISLQFNVLRRMTWEENRLKQKILNQRISGSFSAEARGGAENDREQEAAQSVSPVSFLNIAAAEPQSLQALSSEARLELVAAAARDDSSIPANLRSGAILSVLRSASSSEQFETFTAAAGGRELLEERFEGADRGRLLCLLEKFGLVAWSAPFENPVLVWAGACEHALLPNPQLLAAQLPPGLSSYVDETSLRSFLNGDTVMGQLLGFSGEELAQIAKRGFHLVEQGKIDDAQVVFEGLVYLNPADAYGYIALGAVRQQRGDLTGAICCYSQALRREAKDINALSNRGEVLLMRGELVRALQDFQKVLELDPARSLPASKRVFALVAATRQVVETACPGS